MGTDAGTPFNKHDKNSYELKKIIETGKYTDFFAIFFT